MAVPLYIQKGYNIMNICELQIQYGEQDAQDYRTSETFDSEETAHACMLYDKLSCVGCDGFGTIWQDPQGKQFRLITDIHLVTMADHLHEVAEDMKREK